MTTTTERAPDVAWADTELARMSWILLNGGGAGNRNGSCDDPIRRRATGQRGRSQQKQQAQSTYGRAKTPPKSSRRQRQWHGRSGIHLLSAAKARTETQSWMETATCDSNRTRKAQMGSWLVRPSIQKATVVDGATTICGGRSLVVIYLPLRFLQPSVNDDWTTQTLS